MKVTINFGDELEPAVQNHLSGGESVQDYIRAAVRFFNEALRVVRSGNKAFGYGEASRFRTYNTEMDPEEYLRGNVLA